MLKTGYYTKHEEKLIIDFKKFLARYEQRLSKQYSEEFARQISTDALGFFRELIPRIPYYETRIYRPIILLNAQLIAIVRAMKKHGKTVEDVFRIQTSFFKEDYSKIPRFMGRIYVSRVAGYILSKMAQHGTEEGWEAEVVRGTDEDSFDVSVVTHKCGLVQYLKSEGMTDYLNYCNFSDFLMFDAMGVGLKQPSTLENGKCVFCMKYKGHSEIPESLKVIYSPEDS